MPQNGERVAVDNEYPIATAPHYTLYDVLMGA